MWVSISGGRTSAYMAIRLIQDYSDRYEFKFIYANTGQEHEETLIFLDKIDRQFGLGVVWLEPVINPEKNKGTTHKIINFETASRNGEPFEEMIKVYGIPNQDWPHCTRELKLQVMESYIKSIGWKNEFRAVGIRIDEIKRVCEKASERNILYPLIDFFPTEKDDVLDYFSGKSYDLNLAEHLGNCVTCWKKSDKKLIAILRDEPERFDFFERMEKEHPNSGSNEGHNKRVFFRGHRSVKDLKAFNHAMPELDFGLVDRCVNEECGLI